MITNLLYLLILLAGFPTGLILAKLCYDEILAWRKRFFLISIISFILIIGVYYISADYFKYKFPVIIALFFIIITSLTLIWKASK
jgi:hypothetical protein